MTIPQAMIVLLALLITGCQPLPDHDETGLTRSEAQALNDAASMLDDNSAAAAPNR